jgi:GMP synthase-like glutamine amidotransferase
MRRLLALQHCESEFLGLIEDHLEGRGIRFNYVRPFTGDGRVPGTSFDADGLILMGGGAWGTAGPKRLASLEAELRLTRDALRRAKPIVAWGVGAQILCLAAGGGSVAAKLTFRVARVQRCEDAALDGFMPAQWPLVLFGADRMTPPPDARILARDGLGQPACVQIGERGFAFAGHPGAKPGMLEDLLMEFPDDPVDAAGLPADAPALLAAVRGVQGEIADALVSLMTGLVKATGLMTPPSEAEVRRRTVIPIRN